MKMEEYRSDSNYPVKTVAIVVQPHQQISIGQNRKYGGVERSVTYLIEGLIERGIDVTLYTAKECSLGCNIRRPIGIFNGEFGQQMDPTQLAAYSRKIREDLERENFDVVNNHYDPITFLTLQGIRTPTLTTLRGPANEENVTIFGSFPESNFSAVSNHQKKLYPQNMTFVGVVHNSIDDKHPFSNNKRKYLFSVSRIRPYKGQRNAIEIAKKSGLDLIIAGNFFDEEFFNGEIQPHLTKDLSKPSKQKERKDFIEDTPNHQQTERSVTYVGEITEQERDRLMRHAKAFLFPIEGEDSCPRVLLEAGIVGTPIIAFNTSVVPEMIEQGKTGFYGRSIDELVGFTRRTNEIIPADCREHILRNFNNSRMVDGYLDLYEKVVTIN
ncbi:glycosyltransferase [candidate division KSB1 bacterium]|nr:glycosyltransferase [candidate division KSB1 bacterium]